MSTITALLLSFSMHMGYPGIVLLMTVESSFIPFPSEVVIPPAAYLAAQGQFNIYLVIVSGILGSLLGAIFNYFLAITLGRTIIYSLIDKKIARWLLLDRCKLERSEEYFRRYGALSTFVGRLIPAVRQLISIPAGFSRMKFGRFLLFTALGSGLWTTVLAVVGYVFGANQEAILRYYDIFKYFIYGVIGIGFIALVIYWIMKKARKGQPEERER